MKCVGYSSATAKSNPSNSSTIGRPGVRADLRSWICRLLKHKPRSKRQMASRWVVDRYGSTRPKNGRREVRRAGVVVVVGAAAAGHAAGNSTCLDKARVDL